MSERRVTPALILASFAVTAISGCPRIDREIRQVEQQVQTARKNTLAQLKEISQHGVIDLEVQQQFTAIFTAFQKSLTETGRLPGSWNELMQISPSAILIQDAMERGAKVAWGVTPEQWQNPELQSKFYILMAKDSFDGGWGMSIDGSMHELQSADFGTAVLISQ